MNVNDVKLLIQASHSHSSFTFKLLIQASAVKNMLTRIWCHNRMQSRPPFRFNQGPHSDSIKALIQIQSRPAFGFNQGPHSGTTIWKQVTFSKHTLWRVKIIPLTSPAHPHRATKKRNHRGFHRIGDFEKNRQWRRF